MYAIIENGGKQYKVAPGDIVKLEITEGGKEGVKTQIESGEILFLFNDSEYLTGSKLPASAKVEGTVVGHGKEKKVLIFKKKKRKGYRLKRGHRQGYTEIQITKIER